jgi:transglutaminase-like putative cysteine protease
MSTFKIRHITRYQYENSVRDSANQIMLYPVQDPFQSVLQHTIHVTGNPMIELHIDIFGNDVGTFTQVHPHRELVIDSYLLVNTKPRAIPTDDQPAAVQWQALESLRHHIDFIDFLKKDRFEGADEILALVAQELQTGHTPLQSAQYFSQYIYQNFEYRKGITTIETTPDEIWKLKSGVCQDFAHLLSIVLRFLNIPARYISGYICPKENGMRGEGATHAWVEAYIPFYGWLGLDPTNDCLVNETHVKLAAGKNFSDCSPVKGTYRGTSGHSLDVTVNVAYEDGQAISPDVVAYVQPSGTQPASRNSFRHHQEMQMQQQQQ